ncbi:GNAT family N-acetyltransferase [Thalassolituus alkanivorans]|uniref:GNAT family N-acetyltransferase n=1 Tax=Thalassolituus alkanivorans TaxID=2881055 RepID=UPI001E3AE192|nr:GNAT family N-acetyltransferase [Thalassolituus alkanivorans]MCB2386350.1 GNAT family N-acetyltransferase [Thalassolituus alkanivorans]MCB2422097.1 GNAT family N-acetyltransferase [Thalassolituus alkanivorans]
MSALESGTIVDAPTGNQIDYTVNHVVGVTDIYQLATQLQVDWSIWRAGVFNTFVLPVIQHVDQNDPAAIANATQVYYDYLGEDEHWNWGEKASVLAASPEYDWFTLSTPDGRTQAILIAYHPKASEIESGKIFYIDYVAAAPWNRGIAREPKPQRQFYGLGSIIMKAAARYYIAAGLKPGFSLHSLPKAEEFYSKIGMTCLGRDTGKQNLQSFEMSQKSCNEFISMGIAS